MAKLESCTDFICCHIIRFFLPIRNVCYVIYYVIIRYGFILNPFSKIIFTKSIKPVSADDIYFLLINSLIIFQFYWNFLIPHKKEIAKIKNCIKRRLHKSRFECIAIHTIHVYTYLLSCTHFTEYLCWSRNPLQIYDIVSYYKS